MPVPVDTLWEIEPHTIAKHEILRRYLGAWFVIMGQTNRRIIYLDGFCGPGRYKKR
jgi:three-Cys-motif partner protein